LSSKELSANKGLKQVRLFNRTAQRAPCDAPSD
jgi:hypothetical protein